MKRQLWKTLLTSLGAVVGLVLASSVQAQVERELFLKSYPNAQIVVDGDAGDWNLAQFGSLVIGGLNTGDVHPGDWERVTGTGDIARLGWDDQDENMFYGGVWTGAGLPEEQADHSVKIYARDNATHQYFLVDITDDEINTGDEDAWANDSVEFYIDPENDGDPTDWNSDVQLVIDADNQVQVWNSPVEYEEQVEAGVVSAVTITQTGWLVEVEIAKIAFDPPLPPFLGPANDPAGNNYGIDFMTRDNDDPDDTGNKGGDTFFTHAYDWADPTSSGGFPSKQAGLWGAMIAGEPTVVGDYNNNGELDTGDLDLQAEQIVSQTPNLSFDLNGDNLVNFEDRKVWVEELKNTWIGDANLDLEFNSSDMVQVFAKGKYEKQENAKWEEGDWNGSLRFDSSDMVAAFVGGGYEQGQLEPAAASAVPEPSSILLIVMALLAILTQDPRVRRA